MITDLDIPGVFALVQHELLLFAAVFFLIAAIDEFAIDCLYFVGKVSGHVGSERNDRPDIYQPQPAYPQTNRLSGETAVFIPAWREASVIGTTIQYASKVWPYRNLTFYVGCYRNDTETMAAVISASKGERRVRLVVHDVDGPTSKADCLNRLYRALETDEARGGYSAHMVVLHDAEDMVDAEALAVMDQGLVLADFVQLPVLALPQAQSTWVAGHYSDEFAEAHGKAMVVRDMLGAGLPGAGVGCAISRRMLAKLAEGEPDGMPFAHQSLTEDYELGLKVAALGGKQRFLRVRAPNGRLIATRAYFPGKLELAVRQKTRWTHGIALQSWDRMGWSGGLVRTWMQLRDRRGPLAALVLAVAYALIAVTALNWALVQVGIGEPLKLTPTLEFLLWLNLGFLLWRAVMRFAFSAREYGWWEGALSILRIPISNIIHIMAGRRAITAYCRSLWGSSPSWDKTEHFDHPAIAMRPQEVRA